ncbi:MAG: homocysteine S-methyltransferase family protein [Pseudomonadota bacterium]
MPLHRNQLPQMSGALFLSDAGLETDLIFNHGIAIREFAAHTLLPDPEGREALRRYFEGFLRLARELQVGFILDTTTWKAHRHWSADLGESAAELAEINRRSVAFADALRAAFADNAGPIVINGVVGPRGDAYAPEAAVAVADAEAYHAEQLGWLAKTEVDMVSAVTFTQAEEAAGFARAAVAAGLPSVISFTTETDGRLPTGQPLGEAIDQVDALSGAAPLYFMVNCAHPDHFSSVLGDGGWVRRIRGLRCNASRRSHAELDACETLDAGDPHELAAQYGALAERLPWLNVFGGCCGSDLRHVTAIARALQLRPAAA